MFSFHPTHPRDTQCLTLNPSTRQASGSGSSFSGSGHTLGTKADEEERKKQRLAALEKRSGNGKPRGGTDMEAMRAEILREREKRRAAMKVQSSGGGGASGSAAPNTPTIETDPARVAIADAITKLEKIENSELKSLTIATLSKIAANACDDAFGDGAFTFSCISNRYEDASEEEKIMAVTRVDKRSVKLSNPKIAQLFSFDGTLDSFLKAGFILESEDVIDSSGGQEHVDGRRLTLPHTADVRFVDFLVQTMATICPTAQPQALRTARVADPSFRKKRIVDNTKPPIGGRDVKAFFPAVSKSVKHPLDDSFFKREASEVAEDFARAKAKREASSFLSTKAWKESQKDDEESKNKKNAPVVVRVRLPDGTQLMGKFSQREPVSEVRNFVHSNLREPFRRFGLSFLGAALVGDTDDPNNDNKIPRHSLTGLRTHNVRDTTNPNQKTGFKGVGYGVEGTVVGAGLAPSALVTFSWVDAAVVGTNTDGHPAVLSEAVLKGATPLE